MDGRVWLRASIAMAVVCCGGCGDTEERGDESGGGGGGSCRVSAAPERARSATPSIVELATATDGVSNTGEFERLSPLFRPRLHAIAAGDCGAVGVLHADGSGEVLFANETGAVPVGSDATHASLTFDAECIPEVWTFDPSVGLERHRGDASAPTTFAATTVVPATHGALPVIGGGGGSIEVFTAEQAFGDGATAAGSDGAPHIVLRSFDGAAQAEGLVVAGTRGGTWDAFLAPVPAGLTELVDVAIEIAVGAALADSVLHIVYRKTAFPCDPCDVTLYHAAFRAGAWSESAFLTGVWGPPLDKYIREGELAVTPQGAPVMAGRYEEHVETGSLTHSALRVRAHTGADACGVTVASASDGYAGTDGTDFTGGQPAMAMDGEGRLYVAFADEAAWHTTEGANLVSGQVRLAVGDASGWRVETLFDQVGQSAEAAPLRGVADLQIGVSPDGGTIAVAFAEYTWDTGSIYNVSEHEARATAKLMTLRE